MINDKMFRSVIFSVILSIVSPPGIFASADSSTIGKYDDQNDLLTGEVFHVKASSASVLKWFGYIEKACKVSISYNVTALDVNRICSIDKPASMTISQLLDIILKDYKYTATVAPGRKILIRIDNTEEYPLTGIITDNTSSEKLYGAVVTFTGQNGEKSNCITNEHGVFNIRLKEGSYRMEVFYIGYNNYSSNISLCKPAQMNASLQPTAFEIDEVTVRSYRNESEFSEVSPSGMLSFSGNDLFSQIWILPGVTGTPTGSNFMVDGGSFDENLILLDGVPVFHPGHINPLQPQFNGDVIKNVIFHKGFFPTRLEGGLSSVTEFNLKDGNKKEHIRTLSIDMPAASLTLEGPVLKDKMSYVLGVRRSWLDFFDRLLSEGNRQNHYSFDINAKLSYSLSANSGLKFLAYSTYDEFKFPLYTEKAIPVVKWNNKIFKLSYNGQWGNLGNNTSVYYSSHSNSANADVLGFQYDDTINDALIDGINDGIIDGITDEIADVITDGITEGTTDGINNETDSDFNEDTGDGNYEYNAEAPKFISSGIKTVNISTDFSFSPENIYSARWGLRYSRELYNLMASGNSTATKNVGVNQFSLFYDNSLRITDNLNTRIGVHFVGYLPEKSRNFYSIQPRMSVNYFISNNNLLYLNFSKMEQFYHYLSINGLSLPTDFRMPSIDGFKPRSSEHYEAGWKFNFNSGKNSSAGNGRLELSAFYKTRRNVVAVNPESMSDNSGWNNYIMSGSGESYGVKLYLFYNLSRWTTQFSYTYSRSLEWFDACKELGKLPSLYDIPHYLATSVSYKTSKRSSLSLGCIMKSGKIIASDYWFEDDRELGFRQQREEFNYRIDAGYTYKKDFGNKLLLLRFGLYNILGNPPEEDVINFYSVKWSSHCLPYGSISFRF